MRVDKHKLLLYTVSAVVVLLIFHWIFGGKKDDKKAENRKVQETYKIYAPSLPENLNFAGEPVPLEKFDVRESFDYELLKVMFWHSEILLYIKRANRYFPVVEPILEKYGVPDDFKYLFVAESGMKAEAVSYAGAAGWWQFKKKIAQRYGLIVNNEVDQRFDLEKSTEAACKYLLDAYRHYGSWTMAAAAYNLGQTYLDRAVRFQGQKSFYDLKLNEQTARYVFRVLAFKEIMEHPKKYGLYVEPEQMYQPIKTKVVKVRGSIPSLVEFAKQNNTNYKVLKLLNPWLRSSRLTNKEGRTYYIHVPQEGARIVSD